MDFDTMTDWETLTDHWSHLRGATPVGDMKSPSCRTWNAGMLLLLLLIHDRDWSVAEGLTVPSSRVRAMSTASERLGFGFGFEIFVDR